MAAAVTEEMIDELAIAGTADEVRDQLEQWDELAEHVLLYSPSIGIPGERVQENLDAIVDTFAS